jgi:membrane-associated phospholipid phosphatase
VGVVSKRQSIRETGFELAEAAIFSSAVVAGLKLAVGRSRPDEDRGNTSYRSFRGGFDSGWKSFPSQHTNMAFALAAVSSERIGNGFGWVAYPLAGLIGLSRVHDDRHWASDVLAGAAIGTATGLWVARRHGSKEENSRLYLLPWAPGSEIGLALAGRF